jgi:putative methionine-R-sulfoxide reductase with GAF domain
MTGAKLGIYIQEGTQVIFDDVSHDREMRLPDLVVDSRIIAVITKDGKIIKITDITKASRDFPAAFDPKNQEFLKSYIAEQQQQGQR